jgi:hypothetical protein
VTDEDMEESGRRKGEIDRQSSKKRRSKGIFGVRGLAVKEWREREAICVKKSKE